jgi:hypothetical protein
LVEALPFKGTGPAFFAISFAAQFAFFAVTQIGEGCPLCGGDVVVGVFAAALSACVGAVAVMLGKRRLLAFVLGLALWCARLSAASSGQRAPALRRRAALFASRRRSPFAFRYRPPPLAA